MNEEPKPIGADIPEPPSAPTTPVENTPSSVWSPSGASSAPESAAPVVPAATPPPPDEPAPPAPTASAPGGKPSGLILAALAIIPALIVGVIVYLVASGGSSSGGGSSEAVLDGFVRLSLAQGEDIDSYSGELPAGFPDDLPVMSGADLDGSFAIKSAEGTTFIVAYSVPDGKSDVYQYYLEAMDEDPWQIELSREADDFTGMQFSRPDSADIQGSITISHSDLDDRTAIFVFILDASLTSSGSSSDTPIPTTSRALPPGFPNDVPIYNGKDASIVTDTYFQREAGQNAFLVSFLTKDADVDVMNYYTKEFQSRGWTVTDGVAEAGDFALIIEFDDGKSTMEVQGTIRADVYAADADYTEVSMIIQVSASRGRGN